MTNGKSHQIMIKNIKTKLIRSWRFQGILTDLAESCTKSWVKKGISYTQGCFYTQELYTNLKSGIQRLTLRIIKIFESC